MDDGDREHPRGTRRAGPAGRDTRALHDGPRLALPRAKCTLYDAGLGVALMLRHPGNMAWSGRRVSRDRQPRGCCAHVAGPGRAAVPADLPGTSLRAAVEAGEAPRTHSFSQLTYHTYYDPKRSVRTSTHKLIVNFSNAPRAMDPTQSWIHRSLPADLGGPTIGTSPAMELYDLRSDPDELDNLAGHPEQSEILRELSRCPLRLDAGMRRSPPHRSRSRPAATSSRSAALQEATPHPRK